MEQQKYELSKEQQRLLRTLRQAKKIAAEDLSEKIGRSKSWLAQVERGAVRSIRKNELVTLLANYMDCSEEKIESSGILHNFLKHSLIAPLTQTEQQLQQEIKDISTTFSEYLKIALPDEQRDRLTYIHFLLRCMQQYPGITSLFLENFFPLYDILEYYKELPADQMFTNLTKMMARLSDFMKSELDIAEALTENTDPS